MRISWYVACELRAPAWMRCHAMHVLLFNQGVVLLSNGVQDQSEKGFNTAMARLAYAPAPGQMNTHTHTTQHNIQHNTCNVPCDYAFVCACVLCVVVHTYTINSDHDPVSHVKNGKVKSVPWPPHIACHTANSCTHLQTQEFLAQNLKQMSQQQHQKVHATHLHHVEPCMLDCASILYGEASCVSYLRRRLLLSTCHIDVSGRSGHPCKMCTTVPC